jgi:phosphate transport system substrate-binding protein
MRKTVFTILSVVLIAAISSCGGSNQKASSITAAGATFPMPYYNLAFKNYSKANKILVTYGGIGSGGGIRSLQDKIVDFGATDAFLSDAKLSKMPAEVVHIPTCIGAVVLGYNLEGVESINLTPEVLSNIFLGKIKKWDDPKIKEINPNQTLPSMDITVVHRSDGSGTTYIFSDYLSKISDDWKNTVGKGKSLKWPAGIGAKGNPGVAGTIKQTKGSIGYVGSEYAFAQKIPMATLQNKAGKFIKANLESISASANVDIPSDTRVMLTNSDAEDAYPICGFTWLILYKNQSYDDRSLPQSQATLKLLNWMLDSEAQSITKKVNYAPLPVAAIEKAKEILKSVKFAGKAI